MHFPKPLVSVIVTFYNQENHVREALASVYKQSYRNIEVIVVDDGSCDSTILTIQQTIREGTIFIQQENKGVSAARNAGIMHAGGRYIAFLDGDDRYCAGKIERLVQVLSEYDQSVCAITSGYFKLSPRSWIIGSVSNESKVTIPGQGGVDLFPDMRPSMTVYHRAIFDQLGMFPEHMRFNEDGAYNLRVYRHFPIICIPDRLVLWRISDNGKSRKVLQSFDLALKVMEQKVAYVREWLNDADAEQYEVIHMKNNLRGFLSVKNMSAAFQWRKLMIYRGIDVDGKFMRLAGFCSRYGVNLYSFLRCLSGFVGWFVHLRESFNMKLRSL